MSQDYYEGAEEAEENGGWFSKLVPSLIAIVTLIGALVAWRASVAGNTSSNLDSKGLLAVQNYEASDTRSYIKANQHRAAYVQYLRYRQYAESLAELEPPADATEEEVAALDRRMKEDFDLAAASKYYFFPGRYLNQDGGYEFQLERDEENAAAAQQYDLDYESSFAESDRLGEKVLAMLLMLMVLGVSLWFLALAESIENPARYSLALGGLIFLLLGSIGAYLIDTETTAPKPTADPIVLITWIVAIVITVISLAVGIIALARRGSGKPAAPVAATALPMQPPPPPGAPAGVPEATTESYQQPTAPVPVMAPETPAPVVITVAAPRKRVKWDERLKPLITIMIATVALSAAVITYLQTEASMNAGGANRNTQQFSLQGLSWNMFGEAAQSYHYGDVALTWQQLETLAGYADLAGDVDTAARYRTIRDNIASTSALYDEPYFTEGSIGVPDVDAYIAENYTSTAVEYQEQAAAQSQVNNAWDGKAGTYIAILTFLAVALALLGLSLTVAGVIRLLFVVVGLVLFANTLVLSISTYVSPVPNLPKEAITAYAMGFGASEAGKYEDAIASFDEALGIAPGYGNALAEKGDALVALERYDEAIDVYKLAQAAGRDDLNVAWNLGWVYYLLGRHDEAASTDRHALELDPSAIGVRMNLALSLLASGKYEEAEQEYNTTIARTHDLITRALDRGETVSADFWYYLEAGVADLYNLVFKIEGFDQMEGFDFTFIQAPPLDNIATPPDTQTEAFSHLVTLRSKIAAFEYYAKNGEMPAEVTPDATIEEFRFGAIVEDQAEEVAGADTGNIFPNETKKVTTYFDYQNIHAGQHVAFKIFINFSHFPEYDYSVADWQLEESGDYFVTVNDPYDQFSQTYNMIPGLYTVEMYIDHEFVSTSFFYIMSAAEESASEGETP
jgi:tetratricopeptide (TPR) repeat protein